MPSTTARSGPKSMSYPRRFCSDLQDSSLDTPCPVLLLRLCMDEVASFCTAHLFICIYLSSPIYSFIHVCMYDRECSSWWAGHHCFLRYLTKPWFLPNLASVFDRALYFAFHCLLKVSYLILPWNSLCSLHLRLYLHLHLHLLT